ncbi:glycyl-radical enzyme activating protein [Paenibacillus puldeungensis]|uniref:Glycyl-radical enzyme activating protein n=1 Tax=Paenibacillus puldeungensis TaxID=696536 RepID=A0ABW3RRI0_9BACL
MKNPITGKIYDIQGFSVQDGPGIRTTVFLKGCPLRCPWCHSPESQQFKSQLCWMEMRCVGVDLCGLCLEACPKGAIHPGERVYSELKKKEMQSVVVDRDLCDDCGECAKVCYAEALYMCGKDYTVSEVIDRVIKDKPFYDKSGGGVTISGGEALAQPEFTLALLKACKENGLHVALDTTGFAKWELVKQTLPYVDLYLYDLKHMDSQKHQTVIGVPNERILENAKRIAEAGGKLQVRIPVIPQFNDSRENIKKTGEFCKTLGDAVTLIQLLPYHNLGNMKYERLGRKALLLEAKPPSDRKMNVLKELLEGMGLPVSIH